MSLSIFYSPDQQSRSIVTAFNKGLIVLYYRILDTAFDSIAETCKNANISLKTYEIRRLVTKPHNTFIRNNQVIKPPEKFIKHINLIQFANHEDYALFNVIYQHNQTQNEVLGILKSYSLWDLAVFYSIEDDLDTGLQPV